MGFENPSNPCPPSRGSGDAGGYVRFGRWGIGSGWRDWFDKPQTEVLEDFLDDVRVLYKTDHFHSPETFGANKGINIIYFLDKSGPVFSICF